VRTSWTALFSRRVTIALEPAPSLPRAALGWMLIAPLPNLPPQEVLERAMQPLMLCLARVLRLTATKG